MGENNLVKQKIVRTSVLIVYSVEPNNPKIVINYVEPYKVLRLILFNTNFTGG